MRKPSPGVVIGLVALFVALGGSALAVSGGDTERAKPDSKRLDLKNGWGPYGGDSLAPRYFEVGGVVHLEGALYGGPPDVVAFKLPKGSRPPGELRFPVPSGPGGHGEITIFENGTGVVEGYGDPTDYTGLDGISFRAN